MIFCEKEISPFDAQNQVAFAADCQSAVAKRWSVGFSQRGYACSVSYATREEADAEYERRLLDLRQIYGTPAHRWSGIYSEEETMPIRPSPLLIRTTRFVPNLKSGRRGKTIHNLSLVQIQVSEKLLGQLSKALRMPVF